ncbi:hypothetical protein AB0B63_32225, partial [Micromonospora sp. NPDC049081]
TTSHHECWETACPIHPQNRRITRPTFKDEALARFILLERVIGVALAAVGLVFLTALATTA